MTHGPALSTGVRLREADNGPGHGVANPPAIHGKAEESPAAKTKVLLHDSAFLAERGCLDAGKLARHPGQAHPH
jgi:hypothetical protein